MIAWGLKTRWINRVFKKEAAAEETMLVLIHIPAEINIRINCPTDYGRSNCETYCLTEMEVSIVLREEFCEFKNQLWSHLKTRTKASSPSVSGKLATFWTKLFSWVYCSAEPLKFESEILCKCSSTEGRRWHIENWFCISGKGDVIDHLCEVSCFNKSKPQSNNVEKRLPPHLKPEWLHWPLPDWTWLISVKQGPATGHLIPKGT